VIAYDTTTGAELFRLNIGESIGSGTVPFGTGTMVASKDGRYLAIATPSGVRLLTVPTNIPSPSPTPLPAPTFTARRGMVFDHAGRYLYISTSTGLIERYDLSTSTLQT